MSAVSSSGRVNLWLQWKQLVQALPGKAGGHPLSLGDAGHQESQEKPGTEAFPFPFQAWNVRARTPAHLL
jgi:hypothetical protein